MCLAIYKPKNKNFDYLKLESAWKNNPHGAGLAIQFKNSVQIVKGLMIFDDLVEFLKDNESILHTKNCVLHFRWSTSGSVIPELTHPFPISKSNKDITALDFQAQKAVIHNGVMFQPLLNDYSDTAIFSKWCALKSPNDAEILKVIGNDRLAIVEPSNIKEDIKLLGQWHEIDGLMYSNLYSLNTKVSFYDSFDAIYNDSDIPLYGETCPHCMGDNTEHIGLNTRTYECLDCYTVFNDTSYMSDSLDLVDDTYSEDLNNFIKKSI